MKEEANFGVSLTQAQRLAISDLVPQMNDRLKRDMSRSVKIVLTVSELKSILWCAGEAVVATESVPKQNTLRRIIAAFQQAIRDVHGIKATPPSKRLYQFRITLSDVEPQVWRRIQVKDCSIDRLHEFIQTAMGWTNSHLHRFESLGIVYGDPELLCDDPDCFVGTNSLATKLSEFVPQSGIRFSFSYEYDFGDRWQHDILFEGCLAAEKGVRYPLCIEGEHACPPEDVGGVTGYEDFLKVIADPSNDEHEERRAWAGGDFDPARFDPRSATKCMHRGTP